MKMKVRDLDVVMNCPFCGRIHEVSVNTEDAMAYQEKDLLAQDAFPYLNATEREQIISFICPSCQSSIFGEDDFEEEEEEEEDEYLNCMQESLDSTGQWW